MEFGTITVACQAYSLEEKLDRIKGLGMTIWQPSSPELEKADLAQVKDLVAARGLKMSALGAGVPMSNPAKLAANLADWDKRVAMAAGIGVKHVISRTFPKPADVSDADAWKACIACGKEMVKRAGDKGCFWALETDSGNFVHSLDTALQLIDGVGLEGMKINYDPCNYYVGGGDDAIRVMDALWDRIVHGHIKDGVRPQDGKPHETPVGQGELDYVRIFGELKRRGYQSAMVLEHMKDFDQIAAAWQHVQSCRAKVGC